MTEPANARPIPEDHPVRLLFQSLTERGMEQINIRDKESIRYVSGLMTEFIRLDHMYRYRGEDGRRLEHIAELLAAADEATDHAARLDHYKHLGDLTLFLLGLFPETFDRRRRAISAGYYARQGARSYRIAADLAWAASDPAPFRRLSESFELYVKGLNWVKLYIHDPFFQYVFREYGVT